MSIGQIIKKYFSETQTTKPSNILPCRKRNENGYIMNQWSFIYICKQITL